MSGKTDILKEKVIIITNYQLLNLINLHMILFNIYTEPFRICEKKIDNPIFYIWSNDFKNLKEYFNDDKFIFVENNYNKSITDFYLLNKCTNFIVGPTSFHWWRAWLNYEKENMYKTSKKY